MNDPRKVRLTPQQYVRQRLFNVDKRFAEAPGFLFSVTWYIENYQLEGNISMCYAHGTKKIDGSSRTYEVNNPFCGLPKTTNTQGYWQVKKGELLAKLDNFGPFQFFFTLSCVDARWEEIFSILLHELDLIVTYKVDKETHEIATMITIKQETHITRIFER